MFVKTPVFPFVRFPGVDTILGPEMKSTGEVMGGATTFGAAFAKAQQSVGQRLPEKGSAFISVNNDDKPNVLPIARNLADLGFRILATRGTAAYLRAHGIPVEVVFKVNEGRPNIVDHILNNQVQILVNTPLGRESFFDDRAMRRAAMVYNVPCITTLTGASAAVEAIRAAARSDARRESDSGLPLRDRRQSRRLEYVVSVAMCVAGRDGHRVCSMPPRAVPGRDPRHSHWCRHFCRHFPFSQLSFGGARVRSGWPR